MVEVSTGVNVIKVNGNWVEVQVGGPKLGPDQVTPTLLSGSFLAIPQQQQASRAQSRECSHEEDHEHVECRVFGHESSVASRVLLSRIFSVASECTSGGLHYSELFL